MTFADFEAKFRDELDRMLGQGGFSSARDILAITVNRWSHGYGYVANSLFDGDNYEETLSRARQTGTCGRHRAIMRVSSSAYSNDAAPRPAGGYGRPPRSITASRCSGCGASTATRNGHHCWASGACRTCRSSIATCIWGNAPRKRGPVA
jgi:hypothetical protein